MPPQPSLCSTEMTIQAGYVRVIEPLRGALFFFSNFFSQLSRPGHTDLLPPQAPSAGTSGAGRKGGWGGRIRISAVTPRQRRTDGEITFKHTRLRIFVHDPPSRQPLFSAATHIRAPFGAQVALRIAVPPCFVSGLACTSSSPALVDLPPPKHRCAAFPLNHRAFLRTPRTPPAPPSERSGQMYSERRFN